MPSRDLAISVRNVSKAYRLFAHPGDRVKQFFSLGFRRYYQEFTALDQVSFDVKKGETIGVIGHNGSGKSTLLQILSGIIRPTKGEVRTQGQISALLELGAGFNPEFTGRENVFFQGALMGQSVSEVRARFDDIAQLANIGQFMDQPVRTYSSGMFVRLAFAVAVTIKPDILIVDEALSVGDIVFQAQGIKRMRELIEGGGTLILVSHDMNAIKGLCDRVLFLDRGRLIDDGPSGPICDEYLMQHLVGSAQHEVAEINGMQQIRRSGGTGQAKVVAARIECEPDGVAAYGNNLALHIRLQAASALPKVVVAFYLRDAQQFDVLGTNTTYEDLSITELDEGEFVDIVFRFRNPLRAGLYSVTVILSDDAIDSKFFYDWVDGACHFESVDTPGQRRWAMTCPAIDVQIERQRAPMKMVSSGFSANTRE